MASKYNSLDTNILLYLLIESSEHHKQVLDFIKKSMDRVFLVEDQALIEMIYVFERVLGKSREYISEAVEAIVYEPVFVCHKDTFKEAMSFYVSHPKLSFVDCYLSVRAKEEDATPLWTFDKKLAFQSVSAAMIA